MKKFELRLKKEKVENLNVSELKKFKGGNANKLQEEVSTELFGSRLFCTSNMAGSCRKSRSCSGWICIPF